MMGRGIIIIILVVMKMSFFSLAHKISQRDGAVKKNGNVRT